MRNLIFAIAASLFCMSLYAAPKNYELVSPDGTLKAEITMADGNIRYSVLKNGSLILAPSQVAMNLADGTAYDGNVKLQKTMKASVLQVELSTTSSMAGRSATAIRLISSLAVTLSSSLQAANIAVLLT